MAEISADLRKSIVETTEEPFIPGEIALEFTLIPVPEDEPYTPPEVPINLPLPYQPREYVPVSPEMVPAILDIETTGTMPFDSQLICISIIDIRDVENVITFAGEDERQVITDFINYFEASDINQLIGYNVSFDYRFLFAKAMFYHLAAKALHDAELMDMMNVMKQVKLEFVFGFNTPGRLEQWTEYFFGIPKLLSYEDQLKLWERRELQPIIDNNQNDARVTLMLYALYLYVKGDITG